jgi:hypothetical protein
LDKNGLIAKIQESVMHIDNGRKGQNTDGLEHEVRVSYNKGLALALEAFVEVQMLASTDLKLSVLAEYTFVRQEYELCDPEDTDALSSSNAAIHDIDEAFLALTVLERASDYKSVEQAISHHSKFRYHGMVKDAFHVACAGHAVRIRNILKYHGISLAEKELLKQRYANILTAQAVYLKKQKQALGFE